MGHSVGVFYQRNFVLSADNCDSFTACAPAWHGRRGAKTDEWNQGWFSLRGKRQTESRHDRSDRSHYGFHFPNYHRDDAVVCAPGARARRESARIFDGRFSSRLSDRRNFSDQHPASEKGGLFDGELWLRVLIDFVIVTIT